MPCKRDLQKRPTKETYKTKPDIALHRSIVFSEAKILQHLNLPYDLQKRPIKETHTRDLQKRPVYE